LRISNRIRRFCNSGYYPVALTFFYLAVTGVLSCIADWPAERIASSLIRWVPWNLRFDLFLVLIGLFLCRRDIISSLAELFWHRNGPGRKGHLKKEGVLLIVLVLASFALTCFAAPRVHRIYYDEDIYASMGQAIAETGRTGLVGFGVFEYGEFSADWLTYYKEPSGWPFLLSVVFQIFGTGEVQAFLLNNLILASGVAVVFFIVHTIAGRFFPAFLAALVLALIPHNLIWSNTMAAEPSAALFAGIAVLCLAVYIRTGYPRHLFMTAVVFPLACQMRAESGLMLPWAALALLLIPLADSERFWKRRDFWTIGLLGLILLLPHFLHFLAVGGQSWGAQGAKFSTEYFMNNLLVNGPYYFNNAGFPVLFSILALIGLFFFGTALRWRLLMAAWFFLTWGVFLFFYAGSYKYGADVRFALVTFMPLAALAGMGADRVRAWIESITHLGTSESQESSLHMPGRHYGVLLSILLIISWLPFLPLVRTVGQEAWGARYDRRYALEFIKKIPERSIVLTHVPTLFLVQGKSAIQVDAGIHNPDLIRDLLQRFNGHVYFHYNFWCNIDSDPNPKLCAEIRKLYNLEEIASGREQKYEYGLYKISLKN
jgi:hypothetical protein